MNSFSAMRLKIYAALGLCTIIVLAISTHVNSFMGFYYVADQFPFVLSIITLVFLSGVFSLEYFYSGDVFTARPIVELPWLGALLLTWTGANAFSTSQWRNVQSSDCAEIPIDDDSEFLGPARTWCQEIQVLRATIWFEWTLLLITFTAILTFSLFKSRRGSPHVWTTPFARFTSTRAPSEVWIASHVNSTESFEIIEKNKQAATTGVEGGLSQSPGHLLDITPVAPSRGPSPAPSPQPQGHEAPYDVPASWLNFAEQGLPSTVHAV